MSHELVLRTMIVAAGIAAAFALTDAAGRAGGPGREVYEGRGRCISCHGAAGKGTELGPDLTDEAWSHGDGSAPAIAAIVRQGVPLPAGHPRPMPHTGGGQLTPMEIDAVAGYVHELGHPGGGAVSAADPALPLPHPQPTPGRGATP